MEKVRLIFFIPEFVKGGAGNSIFSLVKNLDKKKFLINIICLGKCEYKNQISKYAKIHELKNKKTIFAQKKISKILDKITINNEKNVLISNFFYANVLISLFQKKRKNLKFIFAERTTLTELFIYFGFLDFLKKKLIKVLVKVFYKKADLIISNSKKVSKDIKKFTNQKSIHIYPGSIKDKKRNVFFFKPLSDKKRIIWIGRLAKEKGLDILVNSFKEINKKSYKVYIYGNGPLKNYLKNKINKFNLQKNLIMKGYKNDISKQIYKFDLLINTSLFEGFPNVVVESLNNSVPVIASRSGGGINEIIANGKYGQLFDITKSNDLKKKILNFIKFPKVLNSKAKISKSHLRNFYEKRSAKQYEKIFLGLFS
ncbi:glycosyltransferase [Candidatus Pelagibacter sp.]|nr:glycosyltransferase [Candidatus Pelagibacter sp.]